MKALKNPLFAGIALAILVAALLPSVSDAARGFRRRVAGSYLAVGQPEGFPPPPTIQFLLTVNHDGTLQASDIGQFGGGNPNIGPSSIAFGAWNRTGYLEIAGTNFNFSFDPTGALFAITQVDFSQRCNDKDCDMIEGQLSIAAFECDVVCPNPQDLPPLVPIFQASVTYTGQRIIAAGADANDDDDDGDKDKDRDRDKDDDDKDKDDD